MFETLHRLGHRLTRLFGEPDLGIGGISYKQPQEIKESLSGRANDIRDGVNLTLQTKQQPLISPTAIQFLEKNQAFVRLPGHLPVTKISLKIAKN